MAHRCKEAPCSPRGSLVGGHVMEGSRKDGLVREVRVLGMEQGQGTKVGEVGRCGAHSPSADGCCQDICLWGSVCSLPEGVPKDCKV